MSRQISTDVARTLGTQIERNFIAEFAEMLIEILQDATSLATQNWAYFIEGFYFVEFLGANNNLVKDGNAASHKTSIPALGDNS